MIQRDYKHGIEKIALGLHAVFESIAALRGLQVGQPLAETAIKVAAFGVQANDFLTLQQFLPQVIAWGDHAPQVRWTQTPFGHPGNWREDAASFSLKAFLDVALKIQNAEWIPGPIKFDVLYEHKITALKDDVKIWSLHLNPSESLTHSAVPQERRVIKRLAKGESLRGSVYMANKRGLFEALMGPPPEKEELFIMVPPPNSGSGYVATEDVKVTCIPKENKLVKELFPQLPEIDWEENH